MIFKILDIIIIIIDNLDLYFYLIAPHFSGASYMCTTKLCSLLEQRQRLSSLLSNTALDPGPALHQAKRAPGMEFVGKRAPGMEFVGKRAPGMEFVGKRSPGMEFVGKRSPGMEFLGKRSPLPLQSKRAPGKSSLLTLVH